MPTAKIGKALDAGEIVRREDRLRGMAEPPLIARWKVSDCSGRSANRSKIGLPYAMVTPSTPVRMQSVIWT